MCVYVFMRANEITEISTTCSVCYQSIRKVEVKIVLGGLNHVHMMYWRKKYYMVPLSQWHRQWMPFGSEIDTARTQPCCTFCRRKLIYFPITSKSIAIYTNCIYFVSFAVICSYVITSIRSFPSPSEQIFSSFHCINVSNIVEISFSFFFLASHQIFRRVRRALTTKSKNREKNEIGRAISHGLIFFLQIWFIVCHNKYLFLIY